jgi:hypothetical protein
MMQLHKEYGAAGLQILALPSDQFGGQELATDAAVEEFAAKHGPFPPGIVLTKGDVNGAGARPTYQFVRAQTQMSDCSWNFKVPNAVIVLPLTCTHHVLLAMPIHQPLTRSWLPSAGQVLSGEGRRGASHPGPSS